MSETLRDNDLARRYPNLSLEDQIIRGAIDVYEDHGWSRSGWSNNNGQDVCILESINVARYGKRKSSAWGVPKSVMQRIYRAMGEDPKGMSKEDLVEEIICWNDTGGKAKKATVVGVLKKALALGRKDGS